MLAMMGQLGQLKPGSSSSGTLATLSSYARWRANLGPAFAGPFFARPRLTISIAALASHGPIARLYHRFRGPGAWRSRAALRKGLCRPDSFDLGMRHGVTMLFT